MEPQAQTPKELIEAISKWIIPIVTIQQDPSTAYDIVCDNFNEFIKKTKKIQEAEKDRNKQEAWADLLQQFRIGINVCPNWLMTEQVMEYFYELNYHVGCVTQLYSTSPKKKLYNQQLIKNE